MPANPSTAYETDNFNQRRQRRGDIYRIFINISHIPQFLLTRVVLEEEEEEDD